jgi:ATP phosphoribosyltransferase regulatory subunit
MNEVLHPALLPLGLRDLLPPEAALEAHVVEHLMRVLASFGYERVKPPLFEYQESLLSGPGAAMAKETFRLMDPLSQRMIGIRADITPQVARIAASRLRQAPRPLRLCYAGQVLRAKGGQLRPARQVGQVGAELIGADGVEADVEVIGLAAEALMTLGIEGLSVDLTLPRLVPAICNAFALSPTTSEAIRAALDHKDAARLAAIGGPASDMLGALLAAAGPARKTLAVLDSLDLPFEAKREGERVASVFGLLQERQPLLGVTVDPVENRGFEYQTGISFTFFVAKARGELGRGGRYETGSGLLDDAGPEAATGFTLFTDAVLEAVPSIPPPKRLFLPVGTAPEIGRRFRNAEGGVTVAGLTPIPDVVAEARRLGCSHALIDGKIVDLG